MNISMSILLKELAAFAPKGKIEHDSLCLKGFRFLSDKLNNFNPDYLFIGNTQYFVSNEDDSSFAAVNSNNILHFYNCEYSELLNSVAATFEKYNDWEYRLKIAAERHANLKEICTIITEVIERPFFITDLYGNILVCNMEEDKIPDYWKEMISQGTVNAKSITGNLYTSDGLPVKDMSAMPQLLTNELDEPPYIGMYIQLNNINCAAIIISQPDESYTAIDTQIVSMLPEYILNASEFTSSSSELMPDIIFLQKLLNGENVNENLIYSFEKSRFPAPWRLFGIRHKTRTDLVNYRILSHFVSTLPINSRSFEFNQQLYVLSAADDKDTLLKALEKNYDLNNYIITVSVPFHALRTLPHVNEQLKKLDSIARSQAGIFSCERFAMDFIIEEIKETPFALSLLHPTIKDLEEYDRANNTELLKTLASFLENDTNLTDTALALNVHRNTLKYRLHRIRELTNMDFSNAREKDYWQLSYWIYSSRT